MTIGERLKILDGKFAEFTALLAMVSKSYSEVYEELAAIAAEGGSEASMLAMDHLMKFQAALIGCQRDLAVTHLEGDSEGK